MFEFLVEKETEARKLSEAEASRVAADVGDLWKDWDEARSKQKTIAEKLRPEIYLDDRPAKDRGEGNWKSDVHLNKIYSLSQTQQAFIWDNIYSNNEKLFDVAGTLDDGTVLRNWSIVVIGRKYLAAFEHNRFIVNPLVNMAVFRDYESKRGIPEIWSIYDIAKEQENKVNLQNDAQALNLNPPAYAPQGFFVKNEIKLAPGKQIEYKPGIDEPSALIKMQFPLISNEQIIEYYDSTASTVSGIFPNMQGQDEAKDATATEIQVKVQGQTTRLAKTLDAIKQNGIVPMVEKVAALDANMKFGDEVVYVENDGMKTAVVIGDTVRQGNYEYKYTDNTGIQRKLAKNQELIQLLGNVWNDQAVPLNKVEIVKDILANAEFENVDKYFLEQNTAMTPQLAGNVQPLPAAGLETREVTNGQANGIDTLA